MAKNIDFPEPRNKFGVVTDVWEGSFTVGTRDGMLSTNYTSKQFAAVIYIGVQLRSIHLCSIT